MGNQARIEDNATYQLQPVTLITIKVKVRKFILVLRSWRRYCISGKIPTVEEYMTHSEADPCGIVAEKVDPFKGDLYRYLNFDRSEDFENFGLFPKRNA